MTIAASTVFECNTSATASNVNGGGFNPSNANFLTDGAATSATGNSPVFTSASYSFVAGDVGAWLYIKSGTNWNANTYYQIASVAGGAATLSAAIGQGNVVTGSTFNFLWAASTTAGCATTASPTGATWGIDYSRGTAARYTATDLTGATTTCTSATNPFTTQMVGNIIHLPSGTGVTAGLYEIVSVSAGTATLDRSAGTSFSAVTYYTGGAFSLNSSTTNQTDSNVFSVVANAGAGSLAGRTFVKQGTYTIAVAVTANNGNFIEGYYQVRGDSPTVANAPLFNNANSFNIGAGSSYCKNVYFYGAGGVTSTATTTNESTLQNCKVISTSSTSAVQLIPQIMGNEVCCYGGIGITGEGNTTIANTTIIGNYIHDCASYGITSSNQSYTIQGNIIASCINGAIHDQAGACLVNGNTLYGTEAQQGAAGAVNLFFNNIVYGFVAGPSFATPSDYNCYYNNTTNLSSCSPGAHDIFINPSFTNVGQVTGTGATTAGSTLTDATKNFTTAGVVAGRDFLYSTTLGAVYGITAVGTTTLTTDIALNTHSGVSYQITIGRNWLPTGAI